MRNTREIAIEYRLTHWAEVMRRRVESGLSIKRFCNEEGMHQNVYHYWQRKLREAAVESLQGKAVESTPALPPSGWAQISAAGKIEKTDEEGVTIEIGKSRVRASELTDIELLRKVCAVLVSLC